MLDEEVHMPASSTVRRTLRGVRRACRPPVLGVVALTLAAAFGSTAAHALITLSPQHEGQFAAGNGAHASFVQIDSAWRGSTVLWNEATTSYGTGDAIGTRGWGTGLWGLADWQTVQQTLAGAGGANAPAITNSWSGTVGTINHGNAQYNHQWAGSWGPASLVPFFDANGTEAEQENWTARFTGYIRVIEAGPYDFSVLNDDGFFLTIFGAGGSRVESGRDFLNPRDRSGVGDSLQLSPGLYGFELGAWNRLEAGVVDLRWRRNDDEPWTLVPMTNLVTPVPEPATVALVVAGLAGLVVLRRRRRRP